MRLIPKIEIKDNNVVKSIQYEGLRKLGDPLFFFNEYNNFFYEILIIDTTASLFEKKINIELLRTLAKNKKIPLNYSGGINNIFDINNLLNNGCDKVTLNTHAINNLDFLAEACEKFGSSTISVLIESKKINNNYICHYKNGREESKYAVNDWIKIIQNLGCGEIILSSMDYDGTKLGPDYNLINSLKDIPNVPIVYSGGCSSISELQYLRDNFDLDGVAFSSFTHYSIKEKKFEILKKNFKYLMDTPK